MRIIAANSNPIISHGMLRAKTSCRNIRALPKRVKERNGEGESGRREGEREREGERSMEGGEKGRGKRCNKELLEMKLLTR